MPESTVTLFASLSNRNNTVPHRITGTRREWNGNEENALLCPLLIASQGKGSKKRFIPKGEGQQYFLLHRSQTDTAHLGESAPSHFVLVQADQVSQLHLLLLIGFRLPILEIKTLSMRTLLLS
jgi:hypothetical protein